MGTALNLDSCELAFNKQELARLRGVQPAEATKPGAPNLTKDLFHGPIYASPSDTCYEGAQASDVVVVEPPHRGDRDKSLDPRNVRSFSIDSHNIGKWL